MGMKFKQAIQIGDNVTDIMKLRCVSYVSKNPAIIKGRYYYYLYPGLMWDYKEDRSHNYIAHTGDWLCEDYDGWWHILKDYEYQQIMKSNDEQ